MRYIELRDTGIATPRKELVAAASERLQAIRDIDGELFINAMQSSALLCIAGVRAESPYHNFSVAISEDHFAQLNRRLEPLGLAIFSEDFLPFARATTVDTTTFSFFNIGALARLPERYEALDEAFPVCATPGDALLTFGYFAAQQFALSKLMDRGVLPRRWLRWWLASHDVRFGMQLGYPGCAISAYVSEMSSLGPRHHDAAELVEVVVNDSMSFNGTQVMFGCAPDQTNVSEVVQTSKLMSSVIDDIRHEWPEQRVLADRTLAAAYRRLLGPV